MTSKYYLNPKGELAYTVKFYGWDKEIVINTVTTSPVPLSMAIKQSSDAILIQDEGHLARVDLINL